MSKPHNLTVETAAALPPSSPREVVAVCVFQDEPEPMNASGEVLRVVRRILDEGDFKGEADSTLLVHAATGEGTHRLLLVGVGARDEVDAHALRRAAATAVRAARNAHAARVNFIMPAGHEGPRATGAVAEGSILGAYENGFYQSDDEDETATARLTIITPTHGDTSAGDSGLREAVERARVVAESVNWTRSLADEPGLSLPPREFARRAALMAEEFGLKVESLSAEEIRARGMGGLLGVAQGSDEEPALIVLRYEPEGVAEDDELWAFVGKGITFDTGGISIKHGLDMYEMKSDMAGGAAALGALRAIAQLKPNRRVAVIVPSAENMPSGKAIKPGDIVRTLAGHTIEVVDTDAEGRLVLVDGIAYAKALGATRIVDLATLTGSIIVALGSHRTGLFSNDDEWAARLLAASERAGEPTWRMPVSDDYRKKIESAIADFKNYGGRPDATSAALLLSKFADATPWVHLDIAGTAWYDDATSYAPKGASGAGVRTLVELVCG
jgi:leucyl aminopeptidase